MTSEAQSRRAPSRVRSWQLVHIGLAATAFAAVLTAAVIPQWGRNTGDAQSARLLTPSVSQPLTDSERFEEEMKLHEALTDAAFGPYVAERDLKAELTSAIAEHEAFVERYFPEVAQATRTRTEVQRVIAEHGALIEAFAP